MATASILNLSSTRKRNRNVVDIMNKKGYFWVATWHAIDVLPTAEFFMQNKMKVKAFVFQLEKGEETGKEHFQCYFEFYFQYTYQQISSNLRKAIPTSGIYWDIRRGTHEEAYAYCTKESTRIADPITFGTFSSGPNNNIVEIEAQSEKPKLMDQAIELVTKGATMNEIAEQCPKAYLLWRNNLQMLILERSAERDWAMEIIVYMGQPGCGKSRKCKETYANAYWWNPPGPGEHQWWPLYKGQETVIIDEYYGQLQWDFLLKLTDRYPLAVETKGGFVQFTSKRIVFTTNDDPEDWYREKKKADGLPCDFQVLRRRINKAYKFFLVCDESGEMDFEMRSMEKWQNPTDPDKRRDWFVAFAKMGGYFAESK